MDSTQEEFEPKSEEMVLFFKYGAKIMKASEEVRSFSNLLTLFKSRFPDVEELQQCLSPTQISFHVKDPNFSVIHQLEDISDLYEGAVIEGKLPENKMSDEDTLNELERLKKKIHLLEEKEESEEPPAQKRRKNYTCEPNAFVLRIRGLPWGTVEADVVEFFTEEKIVDDGVYIVVNWQGRSTGEAYVQFQTAEDMEKGKGRNKKHMRNRYIEIFESNGTEMYRSRCPPDPAGLPIQEGTSIVKMRGLPFSAVEGSIRDFFDGLELVQIHMTKDSRGRASGEAFVEFSSDVERDKGMGRNRNMIGTRYIELFMVTRSECEMPKFYI